MKYDATNLSANHHASTNVTRDVEVFKGVDNAKLFF